MKKILSVVLAVVMLFAVVALAGCSKDPANSDGDNAAALKFGLGVVASYGEPKDTSGEFVATAVAVLLDEVQFAISNEELRKNEPIRR